MHIGIVKWYNAEKGYGVAGTPEGEEYFLHTSEFRSNTEDPVVPGMAVAFEAVTDSRKGRKTGKNWRLVTSPALWATVCDYLGKPSTVEVQGQVKAASILESGIVQILSGRSVIQQSRIAEDYYNRTLKDAFFILYCDVLDICLQRVWETDLSGYAEVSKRIFDYFGASLRSEMVFNVWKERKFRYIGREEQEELEIPQQIIEAYRSKLGLSEFARIKNYSYGAAFLKPLIEAQMQTVSEIPLADFATLYAWADLEGEQAGQERKNWLDTVILERKRLPFRDLLQNLPEVTTSNFRSEYQQAMEFWANTAWAYSETINQSIVTALLAKADSEETRVEIWLGNIPGVELRQDLLKDFFVSAACEKTKRVQILLKLGAQQQENFILSLAAAESSLTAFETLQAFAVKAGDVSALSFKENLSNDAYWAETVCGPVISSTAKQLLGHVPANEVYSLFKADYLADMPEELLVWHIPDYDAPQMQKLCDARKEKPDKILTLVTNKLDYLATGTLTSDDLYNIAAEYLDADTFDGFDAAAYNILEKEDFLKLWEAGKARLFPEKHLSEMLGSGEAEYEKVKGWVRIGKATAQQVGDVLLSYLVQSPVIESRLDFEKARHHIQLLLDLDKNSNLIAIQAIKNPFYNLFLWHQGKDAAFDFEVLRGKFIYFHPNEQATILRRLFYLKEKGELAISLTQLATLTRFDLSLYRETVQAHPDLELDLSTDIVLQALLHFEKKGKFLMTGELLKVALQDLRGFTKKTTQLEHYFEKCEGRANLNFLPCDDRNVRELPFGEGQFYFRISFPNRNTSLVTAVETLPGQRWNPKESIWGVPHRYKAEVIQFAKKHRFFLDFIGGRYLTDNKHLFVLQREDKPPAGITYCEGRLAHIPDKFHNREFWWCSNQQCYQNCETHHSPEKWRDYTLLDFCRILGFNLHTISVVGESAFNGHYYKFISLINRFNRLWERLYCTCCNQVMYPSDVSHFAAYSVVRFSCVNETCQEHRKDVYLNHCLNGRCNHIIDSRISKRCVNGLFICEKCGSCCSHAMLTRRLNNLLKTGGYIHRNLIYCVEHKLGHLERGEYFCYKHMSPMVEAKEDYFKCPDCTVFYDTKIYNLKRPHKGLSKDVHLIDSSNPEQLPDDFTPDFE